MKVTLFVPKNWIGVVFVGIFLFCRADPRVFITLAGQGGYPGNFAKITVPTFRLEGLNGVLCFKIDLGLWV